MVIVGAGLSGLIAANLFPDTEVLEHSKERTTGAHKALLRFRTHDIGKVLGIDFKPVQVRKGIFFEGKFVAPDIRLANYYSDKVVGRLGDRSVWKVEPSERWIAPEDFYEQLLSRAKSRIRWECPLDRPMLRNFYAQREPVISTMPLHLLLSMCEMYHGEATFTAAPIKVQRYRVHGADVYQTIYFPDPSTPLYRASITGDLLILEYMATGLASERNPDVSDGVITTGLPLEHGMPIGEALDAFGLYDGDIGAGKPIEPLTATRQAYGKIAPIDNAWRREAIYQLTQRFGIYSLGRFATWRNILLDDVLQDIWTIKRMMDGDNYNRSLSK